MRCSGRHGHNSGFTLIELLVVVAIISLLISIMMPSLGRARAQSKGVHCLTRLKDLANGMGSYENENSDLLPPCEWNPDPGEHPELLYGWTEIMYGYIWKEQDRLYDPELPEQESFPVQRNIPRSRWEQYFQCKESPFRAQHSGHYRVYLPGWLMGTYSLDEDRRFDLQNMVLDPRLAASRSRIAPRMPLIGDANERSERIDTSYIGAGEANTAGSCGTTGNRFSDRHYGGTNYLFQDFSAHWERNNYRKQLAIDVDLNGIQDVEVAP